MVRLPESDQDCNSPDDVVYIYNTGRDLFDAYISMLDDCYPEIDIGGYKNATSVLLRKIDPIAFRCGFNDFADALLSEGEMSEEIIDEASNYLP